MSNQDFRIVADYDQKELMFPVFIGTFLLGIVGVILSVILILVKYTLDFPVFFQATQLNFWHVLFIMLVFFIGMFMFHELLHAIVSWTYHIPTKFGWGIIGKILPYFSVSLEKPVNRHQYIWIGIMPNLIINVFLAILILITKDQILVSYFVLLLIMHIAGGGGDAALLYTVFKYPSTILLKDSGLQLQILSKDDLEKQPLINQDSPIARVVREKREVLYFFGLFLVVFYLSIITAGVLELILAVLLSDNPNFFLLIETSGNVITISINFVNCLIFSTILTPMIWIIIRKIKTRTISIIKNEK
ncbi:MAG: DUF3267 domain-containing protein [Candidatus Hodarchaeales archaeon]|jgi:hypothetical protein